MARPMEGARRRIAEYVAAAEGRDRYVDLALHLRVLSADFEAPVAEGYRFAAGGVEFVVLAAGKTGVLVRSVERGASRAVRAGAQLVGEVAGVLREEIVLKAGGVWDTFARRMTDREPKNPTFFDLMASQVDQARWFAAWLARHKERRAAGILVSKDIRTVLDYGDRGGGKTIIGLILVVCYLLSVSDAIGYAVSRSRNQAEIDIARNVRDWIPATWYTYRGQPRYAYTFLNGSLLRDMTADSPEDLKQGRVDIALVNEGAKLDRRAYAYPLGRVKEVGGLVWIASNPPTDDVPKGVWVRKLEADAREAQALGQWFPCHVFRTMSVGNAAIDGGAADDVAILMRSVDPRLAAADVDGDMQGALGTRMIHAYDRLLHGLHSPPEVGGAPDITEEFTRRKYGRGFPILAAVDFQDQPFIIGGFFKIYGDFNRPIVWCLSEHTCKGSEDDFLDECEDQGIEVADGKFVECSPGSVLWVGDSSAGWQNSKHKSDDPPSFAAFKGRTYHIVPPTRKIGAASRHAKNPPRGVSFRQLNRWFKDGRLYLAPLAEKISEACRDAKVREVHGSNTGVDPPRLGHPLDVLRYAVWWTEPPDVRRSEAGGGARAYSLPRR